jgi:hypothetical protein
MGNAFTTVSDDYSALMYNPASLAKKKRGEIQFTLAGAGVSKNTLTIMKDISDAEKNAVGDSAKATAISNALDVYYGKPLGARVQAIELFWARPNWGIGLIPVDLTLDMSVNRQLGPALDLNIKKDTTLAYGYGRAVSSTLSVGVLAKAIHRDSVEQTLSALELATNSNVLSQDRFKEGINFDGEIGFLWNPEFSQKKITRKVEPKKIEQKNEVQTGPTPVISLPTKTTDSTEKAAPIESDIKTDDPARVPQSEKIAATLSEVNSADPTVATEKKEAIANTALASADTTVAEKTQPAPPIAAEVKNEVPKKVEPEVITETVSPLAVSLVVRNLVSSNFTKSKMLNKDAVLAPAKIPRTIDLGLGYDLVTLGDLKLRLTAEAKNMLHPNTTVRKSSHAGFEIDYSPGTWFEVQLRAGVNQMYFTAGATLLLGIIEIDAVTYGEEVGTSTTNIENRVSAVKVGFNF